MRGTTVIVLGLLLSTSAYGGDEPPKPPAIPAPAAKPPPPPTPEQAAGAVLAAVKAKDDATLKALAAKDDPDPWIVADELVGRGELDAAEAFATAAPRVDVEKLSAYVASRRGRPDDAAAREALARMNAALAAKDFPAALQAAGPGGAAPPTDLPGVRRAHGFALALKALGRLEEAAAAFREVADAAEQAGWHRRAALAYQLAGVSAWERSDYRGALAAWERALPLCELLGDRLGTLQTIGNLGNVYGHLGQSAKALEQAERVVRLVTELGDESLLSMAIHNLAGCHLALGDRTKALEHFQRALKMAESRGDREQAATTLLNIGSVYDMIANYPKALEHFERALRLSQDLGDRAGAAGCLVAIGSVNLALGNFAKALDLLERGLQEAEATHKRQWAADAVNNLGILHRELRNFPKALECYERALRMADDIGDRSSTVAALVNLGTVYGDLNNRRKSLEYYERGLREAEALGLRHWAANALHNIGGIHEDLGDRAKASECFERGLKMAEDLGDRAGAVTSLVSIGRLHARSGDHAKAIQMLERAVRAAEKLGTNGLLVRALTVLSQARLAAGDAARALSDAHRAVSLVKSVVGGLGEEQGAMAREKFASLFSTGLDASARADDAPEAVFFLESGRAGTMLESLDAREALRRAAIPEPLRLAEGEARSAEKRALLAYAAAQDGGDLPAIRARRQDLESARAKVQEAVERIQREAKKEARLWYPVASPLEDVQGFLGSGEALVLYGLAVGDHQAYAVLLTRDAARIVPLGKASAIVEACEALDATDPGADPAPAFARLRELLVAPLALGKETKRLLVSPEGPLSYVPFAVLVPDLEVAYEPSGTTYGVLLEEKDRRGAQVLSLGDPDYTARFDPTALDVYAPLAQATPGATRGGRLAALPGTRAEAMAIGGVTLLGKDASEGGLRAALAKHKDRWRGVHFACHGLVNPDRPTLSSLALTPDGEDDGFLTALEVLQMQIPSDLVVLSACETGTGKIVGGEGIVGLTRAFMYAGAPRVLCSLWKVDDAATSALMTRLYELWNPKDGKPGLPTAEALKKAQEYVRLQKKWEHPYYWAAWVLWGLPS